MSLVLEIEFWLCFTESDLTFIPSLLSLWPTKDVFSFLSCSYSSYELVKMTLGRVKSFYKGNKMENGKILHWVGHLLWIQLTEVQSCISFGPQELLGVIPEWDPGIIPEHLSVWLE